MVGRSGRCYAQLRACGVHAEATRSALSSRMGGGSGRCEVQEPKATAAANAAAFAVTNRKGHLPATKTTDPFGRSREVETSRNLTGESMRSLFLPLHRLAAGDAWCGKGTHYRYSSVEHIFTYVRMSTHDVPSLQRYARGVAEGFVAFSTFFVAFFAWRARSVHTLSTGGPETSRNLAAGKNMRSFFSPQSLLRYALRPRHLVAGLGPPIKTLPLAQAPPCGRRGFPTVL